MTLFDDNDPTPEVDAGAGVSEMSGVMGVAGGVGAGVADGVGPSVAELGGTVAAAVGEGLPISRCDAVGVAVGAVDGAILNKPLLAAMVGAAVATLGAAVGALVYEPLTMMQGAETPCSHMTPVRRIWLEQQSEPPLVPGMVPQPAPPH